VTLRLLSYNIRRGGVGRVDALARVIRDCEPDVVVLQEATSPDVVRAIAAETAMPEYGSRRGRSLAFLSRVPIARHAWKRPLFSQHAYLELALAGRAAQIVGVHLSAIHAAWTERRRLIELGSLLRALRPAERAFHVLAGDFNTLAPGELLDARRLPARLKPFVWLSGGSIRWKTVAAVLAAGYADAWRSVHPDADGATFPTWEPHLRLDFVFAPAPDVERVRHCEVVRTEASMGASDHFPLLVDLDVDIVAAD
jgi:exodeoxyribonuclease III